MKTYEEMARDVLRRRDEALQKTDWQDETSKYGEVFYPVTNKKRRLLSAIAVPCAAALAIGAVAVGARYIGLRGNVATESGDVGASGTQLPDELVDRPDIPNGADLPDPTDGFKTEIKILDDVPEYIPTPPVLGDLNMLMYGLILPDDEWNSWFGIELDRLGRLHEDWELVSGFEGRHGGPWLYGGDETDSENVGDYMLVGRKVVFELTNYSYNFKEGGYCYDSYYDDSKKYAYDVQVTAEHIGINSDFDPFDSSVCPDDIISYVNGKQALLYHVVDMTNNAMRADIKYGQTIVTISTYDLTEYEFIKIIDEFTSPEYDIKIPPLSEATQERLAEVVRNSTPRIP